MNNSDTTLIEDFSIDLRPLEDAGQIVQFTSASQGALAWFPAWEHADRDLRHFVAADVPIGTESEPYDDADEGWHIRIFEHDGFVYVFEGDDPASEEFARRWRIPRDRYLEAWAVLMQRFNPLLSLEEILASQRDSGEEEN